jgi:predicted Zn-dependent protease
MTGPIHSSEALSEQQADLLKLLGHVYLQHNKPERAAILLYALHALEPEDAAVSKMLAYAYLRSKRPHEAMLLLDPLIDGSEDQPHVHLMRSQAYRLMGRMSDAAWAMRLYVNTRAASLVNRGS